MEVVTDPQEGFTSLAMCGCGFAVCKEAWLYSSKPKNMLPLDTGLYSRVCANCLQLAGEAMVKDMLAHVCYAQQGSNYR